MARSGEWSVEVAVGTKRELLKAASEGYHINGGEIGKRPRVIGLARAERREAVLSFSNIALC